MYRYWYTLLGSLTYSKVFSLRTTQDEIDTQPNPPPLNLLPNFVRKVQY